MPWLLAIGAGVVVAAVGLLATWRRHVQRPLEQSITLSAKRRAELLDETTRQGFKR